MMRPILFFLLLLVAAPAGAQSAVDYYHDAARLYIAEDSAQAERAAEAGLALAPDDRKLQALLEKIRERNEQDQQQDGSGDQDEQNEADEQPQGEGEQQDQNDAGQPQPGDEGEQETQQPDGDPSPEQQPPEGPTDEQDGEREGNTGTEGEPSEGTPQGGGGTASPYDVKPGAMSRAEAERILRAIQSDERELLRDVQRRRARPRYVEKDW